MKVLFINLYPSVNQRYQLSSYVLKGYLEAYCLNKDNLDVQVLNYYVETELDKVANEVLLSGADLIGFSCYVWNINEVIQILRYLKPRMEAKFLLGGPEISVEWAESLDSPSLADYYAVGAGEKILLHLIHYLIGIELSFPPGIAWWGQGSLNYEKPQEKITDLDEIPSIYLNNIIDKELFQGQEAYLETQRGCKYRCKYCVYHKNLDRVYHYSLERVYRELRYLIDDMEVLSLRIFDSIFTHDLERAKSIVRYIINMKNDGIELPFLIYWELMYIGLDEEFMKLTAKLKSRERILNTYSACHMDIPQHYSSLLEDYTVINCIGIQSFNRKALKSVNRIGLVKDKFDLFMRQARENNILLKVDLILGLPFETIESYFEGLNYIIPYFEKTDHILNIHRLQILPGSEMEDICSQYDVQYFPQAPRYVYETKEFSKEDMIIASKRTALLFRVLNSTLRPFIFKIRRDTRLEFMDIIEGLYKTIEKDPQLSKTTLIQADVDDIYWNKQVFSELPSLWLVSYFENYRK